MENLLSRDVENKYASINDRKEQYFTKRYAKNPNYLRLSMDDIFSPGKLAQVIEQFFGVEVVIDKAALEKKSNASERR